MNILVHSGMIRVIQKNSLIILLLWFFLIETLIYTEESFSLLSAGVI